MTTQKPATVPPPSTEKFDKGIAHPALWLWDSWTAEMDGILHLYCLALSRTDADGNHVRPEERNDYPFHIRHFTSGDGGQSWRDRGAQFQPSAQGDGAFARNVWSGGVIALGRTDWVTGFTGIRAAGADRPFLQSICIGSARSPDHLDAGCVTTLLCPLRDYEMIRSAGYYLPAKEQLGASDGEDGGPILAWRDPFILDAGHGQLEIFWSAKIGPARPAVAHATVRRKEGNFVVEALHPPITLPDDGAFTQAEVPKLYLAPDGNTCFMMISACDRINESQPAEEVTKQLRLYRSNSVRGPWTPAFAKNTSIIPDTNDLFGASIFHADFSAGQLHLISPYTEYADAQAQLTFAAPRTISIPATAAEMASTPDLSAK